MDLRRVKLAALIAGWMLVPAPAAAQSMRPEDLAQGRILVAPRDSPDPHFANSVIVLARYDRSGALGLMIHYKSDLTVQKALKDIKGAEKRTDPIYVGGPVDIPVVLGLLRSKSTPEAGDHVAGKVYLLGSRQSVGQAIAAGRTASELRIFIGYAGWGPRQLESEVRRSGWYIFDYDESVVFDEHPDTLWDRMIAKAERRFAILEPVPANPLRAAH